MSSYWDSIRTEVNTLADQLKDNPEAFAIQVQLVEDRVLHTVDLVTGDRDFPDDLRERIQGLIAKKSIRAFEMMKGMFPKIMSTSFRDPREDLKAFWHHELFEDLHSLFHDVATRRHQHRFGGYFSDNPDGFLRVRDEATGDTDSSGDKTN